MGQQKKYKCNRNSGRKEGREGKKEGEKEVLKTDKHTAETFQFKLLEIQKSKRFNKLCTKTQSCRKEMQKLMREKVSPQRDKNTSSMRNSGLTEAL